MQLQISFHAFMRILTLVCAAGSRPLSRFSQHKLMASMTVELPPPEIKSYLEQVYASEIRNVFSVQITGGGIQSLAWIFSTPGASRSVMQAGVPYSRYSLSKLNGINATNCNEATAAEMAKAAARQAAECIIAESNELASISKTRVFGVGCTAALVSTQPKKGPHRFHVSSAAGGKCRIYSVNLEKGLRNRSEEDYVCSRVILDAIGNASFVNSSFLTRYLNPAKEMVQSSSASEFMDVVEHIVESDYYSGADVFDRVFSGATQHAMFVRREQSTSSISDSSLSIDDEFAYVEDIALPPGTIVYPGSFNPLHDGHVGLAAAALRALERTSAVASNAPEGTDSDTALHTPIVFEIGLVNSDKPQLSKEEILLRLRQFDPTTNPVFRRFGINNIAVCVTSKPRFLDKSECFRNCNFLIGADTFTRIVNPKYYPNPKGVSPVDGNYQNMIHALSTMSARGCRFIVGGRSLKSPEKPDEDEFVTLQKMLDTDTPITSDEICNMFTGLTEAEFRLDMSSTEIRESRRSP